MRTIFFKFGLALIAIMAFSYSNAQQTTGDAGKTEDVSQASILNGTVRVIDNKGTKKFLQVKNGLTLLTDVTPDGGYVSTWQLGGTLTDDTYIDINGNVFAINGITTATQGAATSIVSESDGSGTTQSGWAVLVRDEATGETQKILASDLVQAGQLTATAATDGTAPTLADASIPAIYQKVWVYRNGAKLIANVDYTVAAGAVTLVPSTTAPNDWAILSGDVFEVQWIN